MPLPKLTLILGGAASGKSAFAENLVLQGSKATPVYVATAQVFDVDAESGALIAAIHSCKGPVIIVSNEVGQGIVPDNALSRRFRNAQGRLNQRLAAEADLVVNVMAGLPIVLKGALP